MAAASPSDFWVPLWTTSNRPVVATKFAPLPWRLSRRRLLAALKASLERLRMSQVDLYQVHFPLPPLSVETWADGLADAVHGKLARAVGVSNYNVEQMRKAHAVLARRGMPLATNQVEYSLIERKPERSGLVEAAKELGVTLIAYSPLRQGDAHGEVQRAESASRHSEPALQCEEAGRDRAGHRDAQGNRRGAGRQDARAGFA